MGQAIGGFILGVIVAFLFFQFGPQILAGIDFGALRLWGGDDVAVRVVKPFAIRGEPENVSHDNDNRRTGDRGFARRLEIDPVEELGFENPLHEMRAPEDGRSDRTL